MKNGGYESKTYAPGPGGKPLPTVAMAQARATSALDPEYLQRLHDLRLFAAGHQTGSLTDARVSDSGGPITGTQWPEFGLVKPNIEEDGVQNHALVSARINIQAVAYADPEFLIHSDIPEVKLYNEAWLRKRWEQNGWGDTFYDVGMDVEVCGYGVVEHGLNDGGFVDLDYVDPTDVIWDPTVRNPGEARYVWRRERIPYEDAAELFPMLDEEKLEMACKRRSYTSGKTSVSDGRHAAEPDTEFVYAYSYWDDNAHAIFVGDILNPVAVMVFDPPSGLYVESSDPDSKEFPEAPLGLNPFGKIPLTFWVDSSLPGSNKPQSKLYTTAPIAKMLADVERYIVRTVDRGIPIITIATGALDPQTTKDIKEAIESGRTDALRVILSEMPFNQDTVVRTPASEVPQTVLQLRAVLKEELNAATGVMDAQRGQALPGDKTAFEVRTLFSSQGVQARHLRRRFANFIQRCVYTSRWIGALYETEPDQLLDPEGNVIDLQTFDRKTWLSQDVEIIINENSLQYQSSEDMFQKRIAQFRAVDQVGLQLGVLDPVRVLADVYNRIGRPQDAEKLMLPPPPQEGVTGMGQGEMQDGQAIDSIGAIQEIARLAQQQNANQPREQGAGRGPGGQPGGPGGQPGGPDGEAGR